MGEFITHLGKHLFETQRRESSGSPTSAGRCCAGISRLVGLRGDGRDWDFRELGFENNFGTRSERGLSLPDSKYLAGIAREGELCLKPSVGTCGFASAQRHQDVARGLALISPFTQAKATHLLPIHIDFPSSRPRLQVGRSFYKCLNIELGGPQSHSGFYHFSS